VIDERARESLALAARAIAVGVLIGLATWLAVTLSRPAGGVSTIWVGSGILTGILLTSPYRAWAPYLVAAVVGELLARSIVGDNPPIVVGRALASTFDAAVVSCALRVLVGDVRDPEKLLRVAGVAVGSTVLGCATSALIVATTSAATGHAAFAPTFGAWFASHTLGMVIFATLTLVLRELSTRAIGYRGGRWKFARSMGLVAATTLGVFVQQRYPLLFMIYPPLVLGVFRHRFAGFAFGVFIVVAISIVATGNGSGPLSMIAGATFEERTLLLQLFLAITCLTTLPVAVVLAERGRLAARLRQNERDYRMLAVHSRDLVVHMRADGRRLYISPAVTELLGWELDELPELGRELVHPDDAATLAEAMTRLLQTGDPASVIYRARHKHGYYVWIEALARRVPSADPALPAEIVYSGRDVSERIQIEHALADNQRRLRAITDNLPALVAHVDKGERFTFVNAQLCDALDRGPESILGQVMPAVLGWRIYNEIRPRLQAALQGEQVTFEAERGFQGEPRTYQVTYVPEFDDDRSVKGVLMLLFDISILKDAERELDLLARHDSLTGLANRRQFGERLELALARRKREGRPLALLYFDIDSFKKINDTLGHAGGDAVLIEFARRLQRNLRESDLAARLGGDEFVMIIEDAESAAAAEVVAAKIIAAIRPLFSVDAATLQVTTSIGIGIAAAGTDAETLMRAADEALYQAKAAGRNTYRTVATDRESFGQPA
jgi:diguanylate cyclase (GGDEF)-like protein/PAS domain S-box-containing protein